MQAISKKKLRKEIEKGGLLVILIASKDVPFMRTFAPHLNAIKREGIDVYYVGTSGDLGARIEFYKDGELKHTVIGFAPQGELLSIIERIESEPIVVEIEDNFIEGPFEETETKQTEEEN